MIKRSFDEILLLKNSKLIYIQAIIHRCEIVYSIETMNESREFVENRIIKFIILQKIKLKQKILIFSRYIKMIKKL